MHPETEQSCLLTEGHRTVSHASAQDNARHSRCGGRTRVPARVVPRSPSEPALAAGGRCRLCPSLLPPASAPLAHTRSTAAPHPLCGRGALKLEVSVS